MIVTCPNCSSRYVLPESELGGEGRKVQCSECQTIWEQYEDDIGEVIPPSEQPVEAASFEQDIETDLDTDDFPVEDELQEEDVADQVGEDVSEDVTEEDDEAFESDEVASEDDIAALFGDDGQNLDSVDAEGETDAESDTEGVSEKDSEHDSEDQDEEQHESEEGGDEDIPEGVKPVKEDILDSRRFQSVQVPEHEPKPFAGYAAAAAVFLVIFIGLMVFKGPITRGWPSAYAMYGMLGGVGSVPGEGLGFDRIEVIEDHGAYVLSGGVINFTKGEVRVPMIEVSLMSDHDEFMEKWYIEPPKDILQPEENIRFETTLERHKKDQKFQGKPGDLSLRFVLVTRTDEGGGDSTHAPQQDDQAHQSDGEALSESPPHASSQPHQEPAH